MNTTILKCTSEGEFEVKTPLPNYKIEVESAEPEENPLGRDYYCHICSLKIPEERARTLLTWWDKTENDMTCLSCSELINYKVKGLYSHESGNFQVVNKVGDEKPMSEEERLDKMFQDNFID